MSVTTTVDEKIASVKEHIRLAIKDLHEVLDKDTWGHNDLDDKYLEELANAQANLRAIKQKL